MNPTQIAAEAAWNEIMCKPRDTKTCIAILAHYFQTAIENAAEEDHSFMLTEVKRVADDRDYWRTLAQSRAAQGGGEKWKVHGQGASWWIECDGRIIVADLSYPQASAIFNAHNATLAAPTQDTKRLDWLLNETNTPLANHFIAKRVTGGTRLLFTREAIDAAMKEGK